MDNREIELQTTTQLKISQISILESNYLFFSIDFINNVWGNQNLHYEGITHQEILEYFIKEPDIKNLENMLSSKFSKGREYVEMISYTEESLLKLLNGEIDFNYFIEMNNKIKDFEHILEQTDFIISNKLGLISESNAVLFSLDEKIIYFEPSFSIEGANSKIWDNLGEKSFFLSEDALLSKEIQAITFLSKLKIIQEEMDIFNVKQKNIHSILDNPHLFHMKNDSQEAELFNIYFKANNDTLYEKAWNITKNYYKDTDDISLIKIYSCVVLFKLCNLDKMMNLNYPVFIQSQIILPEVNEFIHFIEMYEVNTNLHHNLSIKTNNTEKEKKTKI